MGNPQTIIHRAYETHTWSANGARTRVKLDRGNLLRDIIVTLSGAPTLTGANNTDANTQRGDEWGVVTNIAIIANGNDTLFEMTGNDLWWYNRAFYARNPDVTNGIANTAVANPPFQSSLIIPFWSLRTVRSLDTFLDTSLLTDLTMEVTWGTWTNINSQATGWSTTPTLTVAARESFFRDKFPPGQAPRFMASRRPRRVLSIPAANGDYTLDLTIGGPTYRGFFIGSRTAANVDNPALINRVTLRSGSVRFIDNVNWIDLKNWNELSWSIPRDNINGIGAATNPSGMQNPRRGTTNNNPLAWAYIDLASDAMLSEALDTTGYSTLQFVFNCTASAANEIVVYPHEIYPLR